MNKHGGSGRGQGRPKNAKDKKTKSISIRVLDFAAQQIVVHLNSLSIKERTIYLMSLRDKF